jgi:hypothetical protein
LSPQVAAALTLDDGAALDAGGLESAAVALSDAEACGACALEALGATYGTDADAAGGGGGSSFVHATPAMARTVANSATIAMRAVVERARPRRRKRRDKDVIALTIATGQRRVLWLAA